MCYSNCPFEKSFSGECSAPTQNSKSPNAHCFTGFVCSLCGNVEKEENEWNDNICLNCADENDMVHCIHCGYNSEKCERENENGHDSRICPDCGEKI